MGKFAEAEITLFYLMVQQGTLVPSGLSILKSLLNLTILYPM